MNPASIPPPNKTSSSTALEASRVVTPSATTNQHLRCFSITGFNTKASDQYILVFDAAAVPADGGFTPLILTAFAGLPFSFVWEGGRLFAAGIAVCNSSTAAIKAVGSADCTFDINYRG
jgi:hypothetical protein